MFLKTTFQMHFRMMHERCHQTGASRSVLKKELKSILKYSSYICADTALRLSTHTLHDLILRLRTPLLAYRIFLLFLNKEVDPSNSSITLFS